MAGYSLSSSKCALALSSTCVRANYISNKEETTWLHQHKNPFTFSVVAASALASGRMSELTDLLHSHFFAPRQGSGGRVAQLQGIHSAGSRCHRISQCAG